METNRSRHVAAAASLALAASFGAVAAHATEQDWVATGAPPTTSVTLHQAFDYAFPLVLMGRLRAGMLGTQAAPGAQKLNVWRHARKLSGPQDRWVTTPNADTLYSTLWLDLGQGPVKLSVPDTAERYYSLAFLDMATNNFAMVGRRVSGTRAGSFVVVGPDWSQPLPVGMRVIRAPANDVLVLSRILVSGDADLPAVTALQDQYKVDPLAGGPDRVWSGTLPTERSPQAFVDMANLMLARNPPPRFEDGLLKRFADVGICGAACRWDALPADVKALWAQQLPSLLASLKGGLSSAGAVANGWRYSRDDLGNFGTDYAYRAQIALGGLLALEPAEAIYPSTGVDDKSQPLTGTGRYRLRLPAGSPQVNAFWSLSMYEVEPDGQLFFTANPMGRYAIGDRTAGLMTNKDGAVDIWIQHEAPADPAQRANWLPAPAGDFRLVLRAYEPKAGLRDGRERLPAVERLD
ncbi:MAG: DUF1254 domain-containing protein [Rhodoferax sp.]|nr:DUF1254 domain-containing protein [Rhodoferax sp.]